MAELAAVAGVDPWPLTFAELHHAALCRIDYDAMARAQLFALIANVNRPKNTRRFTPDDFFRSVRHVPKKKRIVTQSEWESKKAFFQSLKKNKGT